MRRGRIDRKHGAVFRFGIFERVSRLKFSVGGTLPCSSFVRRHRITELGRATDRPRDFPTNSLVSSVRATCGAPTSFVAGKKHDSSSKNGISRENSLLFRVNDRAPRRCLRKLPGRRSCARVHTRFSAISVVNPQFIRSVRASTSSVPEAEGTVSIGRQRPVKLNRKK